MCHISNTVALPVKRILKFSHDLTRLVRFLKVVSWKLGRTRHIKTYLSSNSIKKLQLGSGSNLVMGWLNTDYIPSAGRIHLDASEPFPFPDNCFDYVFSEHSIEHIHYLEAKAMFEQCYRVLKSGGRIRIATPNLDVYAGLLKENLSELERDCMSHFFNEWIAIGFQDAKNYKPISNTPSAAFVLNDIFYNYGHRFIYDYQTLSELMREAGFVVTDRPVAGFSTDTNFSGLETHCDRINSAITLVVEARK